ncbi:hypothetical protein ETB97_006812 [Aspergillus alliaceus]|uniref:Uncharacterized protein n=1 Tax=Petromyces alliaceus TaxID=209559 RepID=A0A8H6AHK1_PETAA|nr:hypothetical protein ETB97_006812 [Aspergillus burnettii]
MSDIGPNLSRKRWYAYFYIVSVESKFISLGNYYADPNTEIDPEEIQRFAASAYQSVQNGSVKLTVTDINHGGTEGIYCVEVKTSKGKGKPTEAKAEEAMLGHLCAIKTGLSKYESSHLIPSRG